MEDTEERVRIGRQVSAPHTRTNIPPTTRHEALSVSREVPDEEAGVVASIVATSSGTARVVTIPLISPETMDEIAKRISKVSFCPAKRRVLHPAAQTNQFRAGHDYLENSGDLPVPLAARQQIGLWMVAGFTHGVLP